MLMDKKIQYHKNASSLQSGLSIQNDSNQNPNKKMELDKSCLTSRWKNKIPKQDKINTRYKNSETHTHYYKHAHR